MAHSIDKPPALLAFTLPMFGLLAALGAIVASGGSDLSQRLLLAVVCAATAAGYAALAIKVFKTLAVAQVASAIIAAAAGFWAAGAAGAVGGVVAGVIAARLLFWLHYRRYRKPLEPHASGLQVAWFYSLRLFIGAVFFFLIAPILVILPLSFNAQDFFTFTPAMLQLEPEGYSLKHYHDFFTNNDWQRAFANSLIIAPIATLIAVALGTLAAIGLNQPHVPGRRAIMAVLISPMVVPLIISATGMFFFYSELGNYLQNTLGLPQNFVGFVKVILAHAALGVPFVVITVTATLVGFDRSLTRAAASMGADPVTTFFRVQMPIILPGVVSGGLFAFITSFDEVVVVLFVGSAGQKTLPWQMFTGLREQISPTILAVATLLVVLSIAFLATVEALRRRSARLRGVAA